MHKKLFNILSVLLIVVLLPVTVIVAGKDREVTFTASRRGGTNV